MKLKMKNTLALLGLFSILSGAAFAATTTGTCAVTYGGTTSDRFRSVIFTMTTNTSGGVVNNDAAINGRIVKVIYNPGSTAPTDNWDVTIAAPDGEDILLGNGTNHDTANTEFTYFGGNMGSVFSTTTLTHTVNTLGTWLPWQPITRGVHTITVSGGGSAKTIVVKLLVGQLFQP